MANDLGLGRPVVEDVKDPGVDATFAAVTDPEGIHQAPTPNPHTLRNHIYGIHAGLLTKANYGTGN
jgi:hypothetical protein